MPYRYWRVQGLVPIAWQSLIGEGENWLDRYVLIPSLLAQAVCLAALLLVAWWGGPRRLERSGLNLTTRMAVGPLHTIAIAFGRVAGWLALLLLLWFARVAFNAAGHRADLFRLAESLVLVWVLIRLSSMLVRDERLARAIAVLAWIIASLNIAGLLVPVTDLLDAMAMPIGNYRVSVLLVLRGAATLAIFV